MYVKGQSRSLVKKKWHERKGLIERNAHVKMTALHVAAIPLMDQKLLERFTFSEM